jgi:mono/diheme cytochrome c family protein
MTNWTLATVSTCVLALGAAVASLSAFPESPALSERSASKRPSPARSAAITPAAARAVIDEYCLGCHDRGGAKGDLVLEKFDPANPEQQLPIAEKMIRKLRAGMMPPPGEDRPEAGVLDALVTSLETKIDQTALRRPNPGRRTFQRLNRAEYARSVRDLVGLDVDVAAFLPPDTISHNFDNIADVQLLSPTILEGYLRAATKISRDALGDPEASPGSVTYKVPRTASQFRHVDGAPLGTRGGISVMHTFPADGEYSFRMMLHSIPTGQLYGSTARAEQLEVSINGYRVALLDINPRMSEADPNGMNLQTPPVAVKAGPQRVSAAFIQKSESPVDDLLAPVEHTLADTQIGSALGVTTLPHIRDLAVVGPHQVTGISDTPGRRRIFTCRPVAVDEEEACASKIVSTIARQAYRRPVTPDDVAGLMKFYREGRDGADFESGIRTALQAILASPHFIFRIEEVPAGARAGQNYRINGIDLASRLSFFLWSGPPDEELLAAAQRGTLQTPAVLEKQVRRMLADRRSEALATRFAAQWLRLQDLEKLHPDPLFYPQYDQTLARSMHRETELLFDTIVREDRNVLDLITADFTWVDERLSRHYGFGNVTGTRFRRVSLPDVNRRGLLGQGSILAMTSVADRTSPVLRGKWVLEVLFGSPPPPPPVDVPDLEETKAAEGTRLLSVRERLELHRSNPACRSCHRVIDPLGLALENFDVTGMWRIKDNGVRVDASGELYDGTPLDGPVALREALLKRREVILRTFTENLMAYALGRRVEHFDMSTVRTIVRDANAANNRFSSFALGVVRSAAFQMGRTETVTTPTTAGSSSGNAPPARGRR